LWFRELIKLDDSYYTGCVIKVISEWNGRDWVVNFAGKYICSYATDDGDILTLVVTLRNLFGDERCRNYVALVDKEENTIAHFAEIFHLDKTLRFLQLVLKVAPIRSLNHEDKTSSSIY